jgi:hypothetical protein
MLQSAPSSQSTTSPFVHRGAAARETTTDQQKVYLETDLEALLPKNHPETLSPEKPPRSGQLCGESTPPGGPEKKKIFAGLEAVKSP